MFKVNFLVRHTLYSFLLLLITPFSAQAIPFSSDVSISGSIVFDNTNSSATGTTQGGSINSVLGGSASNSTISGASIIGSNPLAGALMDIGDGFGSSFTVSGTQNGAEGQLFSDYAFSMMNTSATDQYQVTFSVDFSNLANADGTDSYADSQIALTNETTATEIFFSDFTSDVFFGDEENGTTLASFGASLTDGGIVSLDFLLNPLSSVDFSGINELKGGVFDNASQFNGELTSFISVSSVVNLTNPPTTVPAPAALLLMLTGLFGLIVGRSYRHSLN